MRIHVVAALLGLLGLVSGFVLWPAVAALRPVLVRRFRRLFWIHAVGVLSTGGFCVYAHVVSMGDAYMTAVPVYLVGLISLVASAVLIGLPSTSDGPDSSCAGDAGRRADRSKGGGALWRTRLTAGVWAA